MAGHSCPLFFTRRIAAENFFTATLNGRGLTMPSRVPERYPRPPGSRWERHLPRRAVRLSASYVIMLHDESHELFLSLSGSCEIRRLRSSRTAIWEVCGIAAAVDFTNIPSCMLHTVLSVLPGDSHPGTGYILSLAHSALSVLC